MGDDALVHWRVGDRGDRVPHQEAAGSVRPLLASGICKCRLSWCSTPGTRVEMKFAAESESVVPAPFTSPSPNAAMVSPRLRLT